VESHEGSAAGAVTAARAGRPSGRTRKRAVAKAAALLFLRKALI